MCINLANEQLQNFFNEHIFLQEQEECEREGISLDKINFTNNKPVVDVFLEVRFDVVGIGALYVVFSFSRATILTTFSKFKGLSQEPLD